MQKLLIHNPRLIKNEGGLAYSAQIMEEYVLLKNGSILLVSFILGGCHVSDHVEQLSDELKSRVEVLHLSVLLLVLGALAVKDSVSELEVAQLKGSTNSRYVN